MSGKLGMTTTQRMAVLRNQASNLLWYGRLETTLGRAKELRPYTEKIITLAMNTYEDTVETTVTVKDKKGKDVNLLDELEDEIESEIGDVLSPQQALAPISIKESAEQR